MEPCSSMACCFDCILQSGGGGGLSAQIGALQQSWRANPPADFARTELWEGAVAVRYAHLAATAINMRTGGGIWSFVGLSECRGPTLYRRTVGLIEFRVAHPHARATLTDTHSAETSDSRIKRRTKSRHSARRAALERGVSRVSLPRNLR